MMDGRMHMGEFISHLTVDSLSGVEAHCVNTGRSNTQSDSEPYACLCEFASSLSCLSCLFLVYFLIIKSINTIRIIVIGNKPSILSHS